MMFGGPGFGGGFLLGFGTGFISREIAMISIAVAKPLTKSLLKAGMLGMEKTKESLAYLKESFDDMVAEVKEGMEMREPADEDLIEAEDKKKPHRRDDEAKSEAGERGEASKLKPQHKGSAS